MSQKNLYNERLNRAQVTTGVSNNIIYSRVLQLVYQYRLNGDLLEFGAGSGQLLKTLSQERIFNRMTGVDILARPSALDSQIGWIEHDLSYATDFPEKSFDSIISTEVIEHLENPRAVVREWFRLLKSNGLLLMTMPNQESVRAYSGLLCGGHFTAFLGVSYPAHITALLRLDIERIFQETGFTKPQFHYTNSGGIPKIPRISWQQVSFGLLKGRWWSDNIIAVARKPI